MRATPTPKRIHLAGLTLTLLIVACSSPPITPAALRELAPEDPRAEQALELWRQGIELANGFLASEHRTILAPGRIELDETGMRYVTADDVQPIEVRQTTWGSICLTFGFDAQERSWGFVVGGRGEGDALYANSLFLDAGDDWRHPALVASLVLHELTHTVEGVGTVGFWKGFAYYMEAIFLFRYRNHSDERLPYATTEEFLNWVREADRS